MDERQKRENAAFAVVIRLSDEPEVFDTHDEHEGPENEGEDAEHSVHARPGREIRDARAHGVERARPNVAKDDAERSKAQGSPGTAAQSGSGRMGHRW
jgi:hypothetical protein